MQDSPLGYDRALLKSWKERQADLARPSDAEYIDEDIYAARTDPNDPYQPAGLVDRLQAEALEPEVDEQRSRLGRPRVPTTQGF